jgi:hypothetical protein
MFSYNYCTNTQVSRVLAFSLAQKNRAPEDALKINLQSTLTKD